MQPFPHFYHVAATGESVGEVCVEAADLPPLTTAAPPEFDGPGDVWSPETLLVGAIAAAASWSWVIGTWSILSTVAVASGFVALAGSFSRVHSVSWVTV